MFVFLLKVFWRCSRLHGSAATLTKPAACAKLEKPLLVSGLSSTAYSKKNKSAEPPDHVSEAAARDQPTTRAGG